MLIHQTTRSEICALLDANQTTGHWCNLELSRLQCDNRITKERQALVKDKKPPHEHEREKLEGNVAASEASIVVARLLRKEMESLGKGRAGELTDAWGRGAKEQKDR